MLVAKNKPVGRFKPGHEAETEFRPLEEPGQYEEQMESSGSPVLEMEEVNLNSIMIENQKQPRKEDRAITLPPEITISSPKKKSATSLKDAENETKHHTDTLPITHGDTDKHNANGTNKSYSLSKSVINERELVDLKGPISSEIFFSTKTSSILEDYQIGRLLGEGSYGQVKLVRHIRTNTERAMKVIKKAGVPEEEKAVMMKEVSILKSLDHPNIIKIFDLYEDDSKLYIITEYFRFTEVLLWGRTF